MKKNYFFWQGSKETRAVFPNHFRHRLRDLGSVNVEGNWYALPLVFPSEDSLSSGDSVSSDDRMKDVAKDLPRTQVGK